MMRFRSHVRLYLAVIRIGLSGAMEYRANYFINTILTVVVFASVQGSLWYAVYSSSPEANVAGMNLATMLVYTTCSVMCFTLTRNSMREREQAQLIRSGGLNGFLVRPIAHGMYTFALAISERISQSIFVLFPSVAILWCMSFWWNVPVSINGTLCAIPILILGGIMNFLMGLGISYFAFWLDEVWTFHAMKDIALGLLCGTFFPLAALPQPWRSLSEYLPFQYLAYVPASLMNGSIAVSEAPYAFLMAAGWTVFFIACVTLLWRLGLRRYSAFGG